MMDRDGAFRTFFDDEFRSLRRLAFLMTGNWVEAEDLAQEVMVRVYRAWVRIQQEPMAYARTVLVNRHRSMLRRAMVETKHVVARMPDPPSPVNFGEDHMVMWSALADLPPREREVLVLRFYEDLPQHQIAAVMKIPVGTVKSMTHRALGRLRDALGPDIHFSMVSEEL